jgi:hypothetical protein
LGTHHFLYSEFVPRNGYIANPNLSPPFFILLSSG